MQNRRYYLMKKHFSIPFILCAAALIMAMSVGIFFVYTLVLRTIYKNTALEINESFRKEDSVTMIRGDESLRLPSSDVEYYDMFLLDRNTIVYSRKPVPADEETITLDFGKEQLSFTGADDGSAIAISWKTASAEKHFIVRSSTTFMQLSAYYKNCRRKANDEHPKLNYP